MAIDSTTTYAELIAAYDDNASYRANNSTSQCRLFLTCCIILMRRLPAQMNDGTKSVRLDLTVVQQQKKDADTWLSSHDDSDVADQVTRGSFRDLQEPYTDNRRSGYGY